MDNAKPSTKLVHLVLIGVQIIFGIGAVVGKLGLPATNPVLFAFIREGSAGPMLCTLAWWKERCIPKLDRGSLRFLMTGLALFANQFCFIVGIKLSNAVVASAWQPTQPIFVIAISIMVGYEKFTWPKMGGIAFATGGAAFMVFFRQTIKAGSNEFVGNVLFFLNCLGTALYVIWSRPLLKRYPPMTVTGYSYIVASLMMAVAALVVNDSDTLTKFVCPDCTGSSWRVPPGAVLALLYWIVFNSVIAYLMMTWGNKYADPSKVLAYTALQPATSATLSAVIIKAGYTGGLRMPGSNAFGIIFIVIGLALIIYDNSVNEANGVDADGSDDEGELGDKLLSQERAGAEW
jgi:drug/metabolite transporter (DMT)-like permease